ncbi:MAG: hypothetical protein HZB71_13470 [Betaproteobacteria bacterium]|nr:hypothetical protein [Betaproteobacteria bacterium]
MADLVRWAAFLALGAALPAHAELTDPTRPPSSLAAAAGESETPLQLTALYLVGKRPYALINGMSVHVGDPLGDGRVTRIDEQGVWLKGPAGVRQLRLLPEVTKTPAAPPKVTPDKSRK